MPHLHEQLQQVIRIWFAITALAVVGCVTAATWRLYNPQFMVAGGVFLALLWLAVTLRLIQTILVYNNYIRR